MAFINFPSPTPIFPQLPSQAWSVHKEPSYLTDMGVAVSGRSYRLARSVTPRWEFTLTYGGDAWLRDQTQNINPWSPLAGFTELEQIGGLFLGCLGSYGEFYFTDPDDNSRSNQFVGVTAGGNQLYTIYFSWGTGPFTPPLFFPVTGIQSLDAVYFNGVLQSPSAYSLDSSKTILVLTSEPPDGITITADFHFYFRCHFLNDMEEFNQWAKNLWESKSLKFQSVKI